eukprot:Trichotokara_eunicae@DN2171_c0_g1_i1.p1
MEEGNSAGQVRKQFQKELRDLEKRRDQALKKIRKKEEKVEITARFDKEIAELRESYIKKGLITQNEGKEKVSETEEDETDGQSFYSIDEKTMEKRQAKLKKINKEEEERDSADAIQTKGDLEMVIVKAKVDDLGMEIDHIAADGNCMFESLRRSAMNSHLGNPDFVDYKPEDHNLKDAKDVRKFIVDHMRENRETFESFVGLNDDDEYGAENFDAYCDKMETTAIWGGHVELQAASNVYGRCIVIISEDMTHTVGEGLPPIYVTFHRALLALGCHYNSLQPKSI